MTICDPVSNHGPADSQSSRLLVCAPLRLEARGLRRGLAPGAVVRTGLGPRRSERAARDLRRRGAQGGFDALAVAGFGGALGEGLEPGDVVVATEVRSGSGIGGASGNAAKSGDPAASDGDGAGAVHCRSAELLAGELRRRGLRVHTGPVLTVDHVVEGTERAALAESGALAVDMESAPLACAAGESPLAVVRVVVDTADNPLRSPSTARAGWAAMRSLGRVGAALTRWGAAVSSRSALLAGPRSFCAGVDRAIEVVERALEQYEPPVYVRKQIVHNVHVVRDLERRGAIFPNDVISGIRPDR